jgi:hypothetical protein
LFHRLTTACFQILEEVANMTALHIADSETEELVRQLAKGLSTREGQTVRLTEAIKQAVRNELDRCEIEVAEAKPLGGLRAELEKEMRAFVLEYARLRAKANGKKGVGSRVWGMLRAHGSIETLRRLVSSPTSGLKFLAEIGRTEFAVEHIALNPKYRSIIPKDIRDMAQLNLDKYGPKKADS